MIWTCSTLDAIYFGIQDGLREMTESPEDLPVKDTKIWQSTCDWLKKNISDIADLAGGAVKSTVDGVLAKLRGGMNTPLYKYINWKADDI